MPELSALRRVVPALLASALLAAPVVTGAASAATPPAKAPAKHHGPVVHKPVPTLAAWAAPGTTFPQRGIVISAPGGSTVSAGSLHVSENGAPVTGLSLTPLGNPGVGDFAEIVAIDQNSAMSGPGLTAAMSAVRALAASRAANAEVGLVTFDGTASPYLQPTATASRITKLAAGTPWTGTGADLAAAESGALAELTKAGVAAGAVVVISDGVGLSSSAAALAQAKAAAAAAHVPVVTIGLRDAAATAAALNALKAAAPGEFLVATPAGLASTLTGLQGTLTSGYVVRYRSAAPGGHPVSVSVAADGVHGTARFGYAAPVVAAPAPVHHRSSAHPGKVNFAAGYRQHGSLSSAPGFKATPAAGAAPATPAPAAAAPAAQSNFWSSPAAVPVVAIAVALLLGLAIMFALNQPSKRAVRLRVGSFVPTQREVPELPVAADTAAPTGPLAVFARSTWWPPFVEAVAVSRGKYSPMQLVKRAAGAAGVLALLSGLATQSPIPVVLILFVWPLVLRSFVYRAADKQRMKFGDTLPGYLQDLASSIRVGRSFVSALGVVGESADEPTKSEFERAVTDEALGRPLEESLEAVSKRMRSSDMDQVALIAALNRRSGSNVAEALDRVADGARDRADLRREIRALTAQAKLSSLVLTALPGVLLAGLMAISPKYAWPLFHTTMGIVAMVIGAMLVFGGWKVMQKITAVEA